MDKKIEKYISDIEKYSGKKANKKFVEFLAKRLASVMAKTDSSKVACGDKKEMETIRKNLVKAKFEVHDIEKGRKAMANVCDTMKKCRAKSRVTFYYLLAVELKAVKKYMGN